MPVFLSIGECMIELAPVADGLLRKGFAGDTFNTAWYARAFLPKTWQVDYFTGLGDDRASEEMIAFMDNAGIGTRHIARLAGRTPGLYMVHLDHGERSFSYWRSASAARQLADDPDRLAQAIDGADIIYYSGITLAILSPQARTTLIDLCAAARDKGKLVCFDPNLRPRLWSSLDDMRIVTEDAAAKASIVLPGLDDEAAHFGDMSVADTIERYHRLGAASVVAKDGARGATLSIAGKRFHCPAAPPTAIVDTTAAGDSFNGAFLAMLATGADPEDAASLAARVAAEVISHPGALIPADKLGI